jgi:hypothetical protein
LKRDSLFSFFLFSIFVLWPCPVLSPVFKERCICTRNRAQQKNSELVTNDFPTSSFEVIGEVGAGRLSPIAFDSHTARAAAVVGVVNYVIDHSYKVPSDSDD